MSRITQKAMIDEINANTDLSDINATAQGYSGADLEQIRMASKLTPLTVGLDSPTAGTKTLSGTIPGFASGRTVPKSSGADLAWSDGQ